MKKIIGLVILYLLAFVLIVVGVFCGIRLYKEIKAESYVNGSIDISTRQRTAINLKAGRSTETRLSILLTTP